MASNAVTSDDNFFIEEPQKLRHNFFTRDKSLQMVELLAQRHIASPKNGDISTTMGNGLHRNQQIENCRLTYSKKLRRPQQQQQQQQQQQPQQHNTNLPRSYIVRLELICQATLDSDDISIAKQAVDTLESASKSGCCFLEKYIVMLLNFCTTKHVLSDDNDASIHKTKVEELIDKILTLEFDRYQLTENLRRPEYKLTPIEHVIQILRRVQDMLDYRESVAVNWLSVLLDAYFVELATSDEAIDIVDQISAHIDFQCALMRETESTKSLLKAISKQLESTSESNNASSPSNVNKTRHRPVYSIEHIEL